MKNDLSEMSRLAEELEAFVGANGLSDTTLFAVNLTLEEIVTNTISYGFTDGGEHLITISLHLEGSDLHLRVEDDGVAFNPLEREAPDLESAIANRPVGGLGVHLVRTLMDEVHYERVGARNILSMRKSHHENR